MMMFNPFMVEPLFGMGGGGGAPRGRKDKTYIPPTSKYFRGGAGGGTGRGSV